MIIVGVLVVFASIAAVWMRNSLPMFLRARAKILGPPELGKPLTLVLSDVEGSTELWEWNSQVSLAAAQVAVLSHAWGTQSPACALQQRKWQPLSHAAAHWVAPEHAVQRL